MTVDQLVTASQRGAVVSVTASSEAVAGLVELSSPYVVVAPTDVLDHGFPHVQLNDSPPLGPLWRRIALHSEYEPDRVLWVDDADHRLSLPSEPSDWSVQQLLRSVRHLLRWQAYERGDLFLHGGLVSAAGMGIAFLGHKRSGKTSSIISALLNGGADFISNDDLVVTDIDEHASTLIGYGSPRTVNVRTDALLALARTAPTIAALLTDAAHPTNAFAGRHRKQEAIRSSEGASMPGSIWVRCGELARATGRSLLTEAGVDAVVLPHFSSEAGAPVLHRMTPDEAHLILSEHVEQSATKYDPFLAAWYPRTDAVRRARLLRHLADTAPCFRLTQDMQHLPDATSLLLRTLGVVNHVP